MTYEDARDNLKWFISKNNTEDKSQYIPELTLAIEALSKQVPMKIKRVNSLYYCPCCLKEVYKIDESVSSFSRCPNIQCNQYLSWVGVDEE